MKCIVALLVLLSFAQPLCAQDTTGSTLLSRSTQQLSFLRSHVKKYAKEHPRFKTAPPQQAAAQYMEAFMRDWRDAHADAPPAMKKLGNYAATVAPVFISRARGETVKENSLTCHFWKNRALAPFFEEFEHLRSHPPSSQGAFLIGQSSNIYNLASGACPSLDRSTWKRLEKTYRQMPGLIERQLEAEAYTRPEVAERLRKMKERLVRAEPLWNVREALSAGDLEEAFAFLAAALSGQSGLASRLAYSVRDLARAYAEQGREEHAFATLDLLLANTTEVNVPPGAVRPWYVEVDSARGMRRFNRATSSKKDAAVFEPSQKSIELTGTLTNVATGDPFDLSNLRGKIVFFDFWTTWCGPCIREIPKLNAFAEKYGEREDFVFVSVLSDGTTQGMGPREARGFLEKNNVQYLTLYDAAPARLTEQFSVDSFPSKFVVGKEGTLLYRPTDDPDVRLYETTLRAAQAYLEK